MKQEMYNIDLDEIVKIQIYSLDKIKQDYFEMQRKGEIENE